jgi:peptide/nickel transport system substrate-binding protein
MATQREIGRRDFLYLSAVAAGGAMLAACGGDGAPPAGESTAPAGNTPTPADAAPVAPQPTLASEIAEPTAVEAAAEYAESPLLAARVQAGELPPVAERLPKKPYVVPHQWLERGKYGGHMRMASSDVTGVYNFVRESMYGHSPVRWLRDGLAIGPGLAESWESNDDQTEWTFHYREGLKWSDGKPWTTADIMYWWEDMVQNEENPTSAPEETVSATGKTAELRAVDDYTLVMRFDVPAPLTPDKLAKYVKRGIGADWMQPKHYLSQFHPKYNPKLKGKEDWTEDHENKKDQASNPESPTMTGWMLRTYREGQNTVWERNPYYYAVSRQGDQLPYIDGITMSYVQNPEVLRLRFTSGDVDYVHGGHTPLALSDVSLLRRSEARSGLELLFWDSGSGTGSIFFLNQDYRDPKVRELFRDARFRKAISHAFNREEVRRAVYFNQGEPTTGTYSPKALEYRVNREGEQVYRRWRDSAVKYDPTRANALLDEIGMERGEDGLRALPGGGRFRLLLQYSAPGDPEHVRKNQLLARDLRAVGIDTRLDPVSADSKGDQWAQGKLMTTTDWEVGDSPSHAVSIQWLMPIEPSRWAPLQGQFYALRSTPEVREQLDVDPYARTPPRMEPEEGGPVARLWEIYDRAQVETDAMKRHRMIWDMVKIHVEDGPFFMGVVANYPRIVLRRKGLMNVPTREDLRKYAQGGFVNPWHHPTPAVYDPEAYFWDDPAAHGDPSA